MHTNVYDYMSITISDSAVYWNPQMKSFIIPERFVHLIQLDGFHLFNNCQNCNNFKTFCS